MDMEEAIAAGEVIQRPVSAVKELVENSLDAGATHITVTVKEGGLKLLQIQDVGHGARFEDLPILCQCHTTSKLRSNEDLETVGTLGFRGEALASVSFVAHMAVTTMTPGSQHGYKALYKSGKMVTLPGAKPVAAVPGIIITADDMFYNNPARKKAFRSPQEEHNLISDLMQRYAVYKTGVGFTLKRQGEARADLHTLATASRLDTIRTPYGADLAAQLLPFSATAGGPFDASTTIHAPMAFAAEGYVSNLTLVGRKSHLLLFSNGRAVECGQLKRSIEAVYMAQFQASHGCSWTYGCLHVRWEVNVHPTKDAVADAIVAAIERLLSASMHTLTFSTAKLTGTAGLTGAGAAPAGKSQVDQQ